MQRAASTALRADVAVVGGGIVGLAVARELKMARPRLAVAVLEKGNAVALHQSGRNSGVIHAGVYYTPGSLKARLCKEGLERTYAYCAERGIPVQRVGKLIVAVTDAEMPRLKALFERARVNGVRDLQWLDAAELRTVEPHCCGLAAVFSPHTGIVDWAQVARAYAAEFERLGGEILLNHAVTNFASASAPASKDFSDGVAVHCRDRAPMVFSRVITCGGLYADRLAQMAGCSKHPVIVSVRGEFLKLRPAQRHLVRGNIYPVPAPGLPFVGVHFTPRVDGSLWVGPNAVPTFAREGYTYGHINWQELADMAGHSGFQRLAWRHRAFGVAELAGSLSLAIQTRRLRQYIPEISAEDLLPAPAGVRAQALSESGELVDDFVFDTDSHRRIMHVRNAPSPAATSSLAIARVVVERAAAELRLPS